jgi:hypothetical protein
VTRFFEISVFRDRVIIRMIRAEGELSGKAGSWRLDGGVYDAQVDLNGGFAADIVSGADG